MGKEPKEKPITKICKHCKSEMPYDANVCPQCRKKQKKGCLKFFLIAIIAIVVIFIAIAMTTKTPSDAENLDKYKEMSEEDFKAQCEDVEYDDLSRNPDDYAGKAVKVEVRINQLIDDYYISGYTYSEEIGWYEDEYILYESRDGGENLIEDDIVEVYGVYYGLEEMETVLGEKQNLPCITMLYADITGKDE